MVTSPIIRGLNWKVNSWLWCPQTPYTSHIVWFTKCMQGLLTLTNSMCYFIYCRLSLSVISLTPKVTHLNGVGNMCYQRHVTKCTFNIICNLSSVVCACLVYHQTWKLLFLHTGSSCGSCCFPHILSSSHPQKLVSVSAATVINTPGPVV